MLFVVLVWIAGDNKTKPNCSILRIAGGIEILSPCQEKHMKSFNDHSLPQYSEYLFTQTPSQWDSNQYLMKNFPTIWQLLSFFLPNILLSFFFHNTLLSFFPNTLFCDFPTDSPPNLPPPLVYFFFFPFSGYSFVLLAIHLLFQRWSSA